MSMLNGRIIGQEKDRYRIYLEESDLLLPAVVRGKLLHAAVDARDLPVVGDRAWITPERELAVIERIQPRKSLLARQTPNGPQPIAANVDYVLIAMSLNQDFSENRVDRYLTLAWESGAQPVVVLTKRDLSSEWREISARLTTRFPGVAVHAVSIGELTGLDEYTGGGLTSVIVGSSGVGKSTLINGLLGREVLATQAAREGDDKGRHTTTSRSMWRTPAGGWVIDSPGVRELQMLAVEEGLTSAFQDIETLSARCRFGNCSHASEPGCAIRKALECGELANARWQSFQKLEREIAFERRKADPVAASEERAKWKRIHKEQRRARREREE